MTKSCNRHFRERNVPQPRQYGLLTDTIMIWCVNNSLIPATRIESCLASTTTRGFYLFILLATASHAFHCPLLTKPNVSLTDLQPHREIVPNLPPTISFSDLRRFRLVRRSSKRAKPASADACPAPPPQLRASDGNRARRASPSPRYPSQLPAYLASCVPRFVYVNYHPYQRPVAKAADRRRLDAVNQCARLLR